MTFKDVTDLSDHFTISALCSTYGSIGSFKIVAQILQWLAQPFESDETENEMQRILLIRSAVEFFVTKVSIDDDELIGISNIDLGDKIDDLRTVRDLATELTNKGAGVYDLLTKELVNKETLNLQASRPLELSTVRKYLKNAIFSMTQKISSSKRQLESRKTEKTTMERKTAELERSKQRLDALQKIRPAFLEEFERFEGELKGLFEQYFIRVRCLDALRIQAASRLKVQTLIPIAKPSENSISFLPDGLIDSDKEGMDEEDVEHRIIDKKREQRRTCCDN